jgi:hypothetical protein
MKYKDLNHVLLIINTIQTITSVMSNTISTSYSNTISFLPLTTIFTAPADCATRDLTLQPGASPSNKILQGNPSDHGAATLSCYPPGFSYKGTALSPFSPGLFCPAGMTTAATTVVSQGSNIQTSVVCCSR